MIREGKVLLKVEVPKVVSSEMPVFYNPTMVVNRDISLLILWAMEGEELVVCDPMGASGVRSLEVFVGGAKGKKGHIQRHRPKGSRKLQGASAVQPSTRGESGDIL
jgi:hypothetical protein